MPIINLVYEAPEQWGRQPWANTYMYRPLVSNANDESWNSRNGTLYGTLTWNDWAVFAWSWQISSPINTMPSAFTISCWVEKGQTASEQTLFAKWWSNYNHQRFWMYYDNSRTLYVYRVTGYDSGGWVSVGNLGYWTWKNIIYTKDSSWNSVVYVDWVATNSFANSWWDNVTTTYLWIWWWTSSQSNFYWTIKDFIVEDKVRTAQEISDYYNQTKWDYWIS